MPNLLQLAAELTAIRAPNLCDYALSALPAEEIIYFTVQAENESGISAQSAVLSAVANHTPKRTEASPSPAVRTEVAKDSRTAIFQIDGDPYAMKAYNSCMSGAVARKARRDNELLRLLADFEEEQGGPRLPIPSESEREQGMKDLCRCWAHQLTLDPSGTSTAGDKVRRMQGSRFRDLYFDLSGEFDRGRAMSTLSLMNAHGKCGFPDNSPASTALNIIMVGTEIP